MPRKKREKNLQELSTWICRHPLRKNILLAFNHPKLPSDIYAHKEKISRQNKFLFLYHFQILADLKIVESLIPDTTFKNPGKVYGLTEKGLKIKKIICNEENKNCIYEQLNDIDWYKYGKVILGSQRVALLNALDNEHPQRICELEKKIKKLNYRPRTQEIAGQPYDKAWGMARQNVNNALQWLVKQDIALGEKFPRRKRRHKPITKYRLTKEGELIKRQLGQPQT